MVTRMATPPTGSPLSTFIAVTLGTQVNGCGGFPNGQCTTLACAWCRNLGLGTPCSTCAAPNKCDGACWQGSGFAGWTWIPYAPGRVPSPGDVVCYHPCSADGIGSSGHVGIFVSGDGTSFTGLDQNWGGQIVKLNTHGYECVVGWQHPGGGPPPPPPCNPPCVPPKVCINNVCRTPVPLVSAGATVSLALIGAAGVLALLALRPDVRTALEARELEAQQAIFGGSPPTRRTLVTRRAVNPLRRVPSEVGSHAGSGYS
jgi:hypothetical protein